MEGFRNELTVYALCYFNEKVSSNTGTGKSPVAGFAVVEEIDQQIAFEELNFIHFVRTNSRRIVEKGGIGFVFDSKRSKELCMVLKGYLVGKGTDIFGIGGFFTGQPQIDAAYPRILVCRFLGDLLVKNKVL